LIENLELEISSECCIL